MALSMTESAGDPSIFAGGAQWEDLAIENMEDRGTPSSPYGEVILDFALQYGGGKDSSDIKFTHDVASHFGCSNVFGETFWNAVTQTPLQTKQGVFHC